MENLRVIPIMVCNGALMLILMTVQRHGVVWKTHLCQINLCMGWGMQVEPQLCQKYWSIMKWLIDFTKSNQQCRLLKVLILYLTCPLLCQELHQHLAQYTTLTINRDRRHHSQVIINSLRGSSSCKRSTSCYWLSNITNWQGDKDLKSSFQPEDDVHI